MFPEVTDEQWNDWKWQVKNRIETLDELKKYVKLTAEEESSDNFSADGRVYQKIGTLHIELYTDLKQPELEASIEAVLDGHDIFYNKTEVWIESEHLYEVLYSTEVLRTD